MVPCITIGDSIAVGVGQARAECEIVARVGISSARYVATLLPTLPPPGRTGAGTAVISLGVNDGDTSNTLENLRRVRERVDATSVVWLLPGLKPEVRDMIRTVAEENGDRTLDTRPEVGRDRLHPTGAGYERLAAAAIGASDGGVEVADAPEDRPAPRAATRRALRHARTLHGKAAPAARPTRSAIARPSAHPAARPAAAHVACPRHCHTRALRS